MLAALLAYGGVACGGGGGAQGTLGVRLAAIAQLHASGRAVNLRRFPPRRAPAATAGRGRRAKGPGGGGACRVLRKRGSRRWRAPRARRRHHRRGAAGGAPRRAPSGRRLPRRRLRVQPRRVGHPPELTPSAPQRCGRALRAGAPRAAPPGVRPRLRAAAVVCERVAAPPGAARGGELVGNEAMEGVAAAMVEEGVDEAPRAEFSHLEVAAARRVLERGWRRRRISQFKMVYWTAHVLEDAWSPLGTHIGKLPMWVTSNYSVTWPNTYRS